VTQRHRMRQTASATARTPQPLPEADLVRQRDSLPPAASPGHPSGRADRRLPVRGGFRLRRAPGR
jgi:hypothetical protein